MDAEYLSYRALLLPDAAGRLWVCVVCQSVVMAPTERELQNCRVCALIVQMRMRG